MNISASNSLAIERATQTRATHRPLSSARSSLLGAAGLGLALAAILSFAQPVRAQSPVAHYQFTTSGAVTSDSSGNNNTLTLVNGAAYDASGQSGGCLLLDGVDDYAQASNSSSLNITGNKITVMAWVRFNVINNTTDIIVCKPKSTTEHTNPFYAYSLFRRPDGKLRFWVTVGGSGKFVEGSTVVANTWYHFAGVYDGAQVKLYINGAASGTPTSATGNITGYTTPLRIGVNGTAGERLNGRIDDLRIYNVALTQAQIQAIMAPPPAAPSGLTATAFSTSQINLVWTDNSSNETGFKIERKTGSGGTYAQVATVGANVTSYNDTTLIADTTYYYRVRATNAGGDSAYSNEASATTLFNGQAPFGGISWVVPGRIEAENYDTGGQNVAYYDTTTGNTGGAYRTDDVDIKATTDAGGGYAVGWWIAGEWLEYTINVPYSGTFDLKLRIGSKLAGRTVHVEFDGIDATGPIAVPQMPDWDQYQTVTVGDVFVPEGQPVMRIVQGPLSNVDFNWIEIVSPTPAAPGNLNAMAVSSSQINLTWTDNASNEVGFFIERKTGVGGIYAQVGSTGANTTSYSDTGLSASTTYYYRVLAHNASGNSEYSNEANATTQASGAPPAAPSNLAATAVSTSQINLTWTDNSNNEDGFKIERKTGAGGTYSQIATVGAGAVGFNNTGLSASTTYYYRVRANNAFGDSAFSNEANATTPASGSNPPPTPNITFNSGNPYTATKVNDQPAGTVFRFTNTGNGSGGGTYTNVTIPTKDGNKYTFDAGTLLDGTDSSNAAFGTSAINVEIYDCSFTRYRGVNHAGNPDVQGAGAILMRSGWKVYRPHGYNNKYAAISFAGSNGLIAGGRLNNNRQYGFHGTSSGGEIRDCEVDFNGIATGLDVGNNRGGCKITHSNGFKFIRVHSHHNYREGLWTDINNINILYDDCDVHENQSAGIFHEVSLSAEIRNCRVWNNWLNTVSDLWPTKGQIDISNSPDVWIHNNVISGGYYGISVYNSNHNQWRMGKITNGCLGVRNLLVENNTITMYNDGSKQWIAVEALTGGIPSDRSTDQQCNQKPITDPLSNNRFQNNTVIKSGGKYPSTPYIHGGSHVSDAFWVSKGFN